MKRRKTENGAIIYEGFKLGDDEYNIWVYDDWLSKRKYAQFGSMRISYSYLMEIKAYGKTEKQAVNKLKKIANAEYKRIKKLTATKMPTKRQKEIIKFARLRRELD